MLVRCTGWFLVPESDFKMSDDKDLNNKDLDEVSGGMGGGLGKSPVHERNLAERDLNPQPLPPRQTPRETRD